VLLTRRSAALLGLILLLAATLRLLLVLHAPAFIIRGDSAEYYEPAHNLVRDGELELPPKRAPLYPLFLAGGIAALGPHLEPLVALQHLLGLGSVVLVYLLGALSFGRGAGLLAALLSAMHGTLLFYEHTIASEALYVPLLLAGLVGCLLGLRSGWTGWFLVAGCVLGLGALTRPLAQVLVPLVGGTVLLQQRWPWRQRLMAVVLVGLGYVLTVAPWTAYNWSARGLVGTGGGLGDALFERIRRHDPGFQYEDLEAPADGSRQARIRQRTFELAQRHDRHYPVRQALEREFDLDSARGDAALREVALQVIKQEPWRYLSGTVAMFVQLIVGPGWDRSLDEYWETRFDRDEIGRFPMPVRTISPSSLPTTEADRAITERLVNLYRDSWLGLWLAPVLFVGSARCLAAGWNGGLLLLPTVVVIQLLLYAALDGPLERFRVACAPLLMLLAVGGLTQLPAVASGIFQRTRSARSGVAIEPGARPVWGSGGRGPTAP
jgi:4-amino-4-deoxy-L-arabinose transferase-like glycosyltransferase